MERYKTAFKDVNILITGGLGFIGSNLAIELVKLGANVTIVDAMIPFLGANPFNVQDIKDKIEILIGDIRDENIMSKVVKNKDYIFNLAGQVSHVDSIKDPLIDIDINCRGNIVFLEACRKFNPNVKIIYSGTRGQFGKAEYLPVDEKHKMQPQGIYGVTKMAGEQFHLLYHNIYGLKTCSIRITNTYGPRHQMKHDRYGVLNWFIRKAIDGEKIKVFGDGQQIRDFNFVDDVVDAFLLTALGKSEGEVFNLGSGEPIKIIDIVKLVLEISDKGDFEFTSFSKERREIEIGHYIADFSKIRNNFGWEPKISLRDGLIKTIEFYKKNKDKYWS